MLKRKHSHPVAVLLGWCVQLSMIMLLAGVVDAQENGFPQAKIAFDRKEYVAARESFSALAESGDRRAMFYLGVIYDRGLGITSDPAQAVLWYEKAALREHPEAQFNLGNAYKHGRGTVASEELASLWWEKAAAQGQINAQYNLALQYNFGNGVAQDSARAIHLIQDAASGGHATAQSLIDSGKIPPKPVEQQAEANSLDKSQLISEIRQVQVDRNLVVELPIFKHDWLSFQSPERFTVQLAYMSNMAYLEDFLLKNQLLDRVMVVETLKEDKKYYYVFLGTYDTRTQATAQLTAFGELQPFVRTFADLQSR